MECLVDTDVLIDVAKDNEGASAFLDSVSGWSISLVTAMELMVGARDKRDARRIDQLVATFSVIPLTPAVGETAYYLVKKYSGSHGLRVFDALIAATALDAGLTVVTRNEKHFRMIPKLKLRVPRY